MTPLLQVCQFPVLSHPLSWTQYAQRPLLIRPQTTFFSGSYRTNFAPIKSSVQIEDSVLNVVDRRREGKMSNVQFHRIFVIPYSSIEVHTFLVRKHEAKTPLGRTRCRWENNIRMDLEESIERTWT
jgi:hypothetical protein